jgi:hypothetical protein
MSPPSAGAAPTAPLLTRATFTGPTTDTAPGPQTLRAVDRRGIPAPPRLTGAAAWTGNPEPCTLYPKP